MSTEENRALALEFVDQVYNRGRVELVERYVGSDVLYPGSEPGLEGAVGSISRLRETFPNLECKAVDTISQDDRVVLRLAGKGTQTGLFMGLSPTGKSIKFWGVMIFRFRDRKIVELWNLIDIAGVLAQMRG